MKTLSALIIGGALTLGTAMAQDAPKPANSRRTGRNQTQVKKHRKHHKKGATAVKTAPAAPATATTPARSKGGRP